MVKCDHGIARGGLASDVVLGYRYFEGYTGLIVVGDLIWLLKNCEIYW